MGGSKGGSADESGMYEAMASAQAAQMAYQLGEQQFQWSQSVWNQEQPLINASEQQQMALAAQQQQSLAQSQAESQQQWQQYLDTYAPLEKTFVGQAENWASPENIALVQGQAMGSVAQQGQGGMNAAAETLRSYGVNPSAPRYASLYTSAQPLLGAAEAAAGTTAAQNLRLQQLGLESSAINTGRNLTSTAGNLTQAGTGAGQAATTSASGAANTAQSNLQGTAVGAGATSQLFNAGSNAMNTYVNAVNGYNQAQADYAAANAQETGSLGSALGSILGMGMMKIAKGGAVGYQEGGDVAGNVSPGIPPQAEMATTQGGGPSGIPSQPIPPGGTPGGAVPITASPSMGQNPDDVPAQLTANEFVIPRDVATWKGHEYFAKQIDAARKGQQQFSQRDDIGGEPTGAIPQRPNFISRPVHSGAGIPGGQAPQLAQQGVASQMGGAIPVNPLYQGAQW